MKLYEFFGHLNLGLNKDTDKDPSKHNVEKEHELATDVFYHILDNDLLHKKYFMPTAKKIKLAKDDNDPETDSHNWKLWLPMVDAGCVDYYKSHKLDDHPNKIFTKNFRKELCQKLVDHYYEDIIKGEYKL